MNLLRICTVFLEVNLVHHYVKKKMNLLNECTSVVKLFHHNVLYIFVYQVKMVLIFRWIKLCRWDRPLFRQ